MSTATKTTQPAMVCRYCQVEVTHDAKEITGDECFPCWSAFYHEACDVAQRECLVLTGKLPERFIGC